MPLDGNYNNLNSSFLGVATGDEVLDLADKSDKNFFTSTMTFNPSSRAKFSGREVVSGILAGKRERTEIFVGSSEARLWSYSGNSAVSQYKNVKVDERTYSARGPILQGQSKFGPSVALGDYSHFKLSIGESKDGSQSVIVSTANISPRAYQNSLQATGWVLEGNIQGAHIPRNEADLYYRTSNPEAVKEAKQIYSYATGKSTEYPRGTDGKGLKHFLFSSPGHSITHDVVNQIDSAKNVIYVATANLNNPEVVEALMRAAKAGKEVHVGVTEHEHNNPAFTASIERAKKIAASGKNAHFYLFDEGFTGEGLNYLQTGHGNFIITDDDGLMGSARMTSSALGGQTSELLVKVKNDPQAIKNLKSYFNKYYKEQDSTKTNLSYSTFSGQLLKFMPQRSGSENKRYVVDPTMLTGAREWGLLNLRAKAIYSLDQKTYWNGFGGLLDKPYRESLDDFLRSFEEGPGFAENMARQLQAFYGREFLDPLPQSVQSNVRAFDLGIQYRTIGQSDWWSASGYGLAAGMGIAARQAVYGRYNNFSAGAPSIAEAATRNQSLVNRWFPDVSRYTNKIEGMNLKKGGPYKAVRHGLNHPVGAGLLAAAATTLAFKTLETGFSGDIYVQVGNRGPLATAVQRISKQIDNAQGDYYGIEPDHTKAGIFESTAMFGVNAAESLIQNIVGYYAVSRPLMVLASSWWKNIDEGLKARQERTFAGGTPTLIERALPRDWAAGALRVSEGFDRFLKHGYARFLDNLARPIVEFFGGERWLNLLDRTTKELYGKDRKFREVRVRFIQGVDDLMASSPYTRFLSNEGLGAYFSAFNPGKLFEFGQRGVEALRGLYQDVRVMPQFTQHVAEIQRLASVRTASESTAAQRGAADARLRDLIRSGTMDDFIDADTRTALRQDRASLNNLQRERTITERVISRGIGSEETALNRLRELDNEIASLEARITNSSTSVWQKIANKPAFYQFNYHIDKLMTDLRSTYAEATGFAPGSNVRVLNTNRMFSRSALGAAGLLLFADSMAGYVSAAPRATVLSQYLAARSINRYAANLGGPSPWSGGSYVPGAGSSGHADLLMFYTPGAGRYDKYLQDMTASTLEEYSSARIFGNIGVGLGVGAIAGASGIFRAARNAKPQELLRTGGTRGALGFAAGFLAAKGIAGVVGLSLAAVSYFTFERMAASTLNLANIYGQNDFRNEISGHGAFSISQFSAEGRIMEQALQGRNRARLQASAEALEHMGYQSQATQLAMMSILGPTENQLNHTGRMATGKAIQFSLNPMLFTLTYAENKIGSETSLSASFQAPALFELGLTFQAPFKFVDKTKAEALIDQSRGMVPGQETLGSRMFAAGFGGVFAAGTITAATLLRNAGAIPGVGGILAAGAIGAGIGGFAGAYGLQQVSQFMPGSGPITSWLLNQNKLEFDPNASSSLWLYGAIAGYGLSTIHEGLASGFGAAAQRSETVRSIARSFPIVSSAFNVTGSALRAYNRFITAVPRALVVAPIENVLNSIIDTTVSRVLQNNYGLTIEEVDNILRAEEGGTRNLGALRFSAILGAINNKRTPATAITETSGSWLDRWREERAARTAPGTQANVLRWWEKLLFGMERFGSRMAYEADHYLRMPHRVATQRVTAQSTLDHNRLTAAAQTYRSSAIGRMYRGGRLTFGIAAAGLVIGSVYQGMRASSMGGDEIYRISKEQTRDLSDIHAGVGQYSGTLGSIWGFAKSIWYGFAGVGKETHPLEETFVGVSDRSPFDNKDYRRTEEGNTNAFYRLAGHMGKAISSLIYFGQGAAFIGTGVYGSVMGQEGDSMTWAKSYFQPSLIPGINFAYSSGVVSLKDRTDFGEYVNRLNFQTGSTRGAVSWLSNRVRMRKKSLTVGKLFHDKSALSQLGTAGQAEMHRRFELTRWTTKNNVGLDAAIYFQLDHSYQAQRLNSLASGNRINPFIDRFAPNYRKEAPGFSGVYFKSDDKLSITQSIYEALVGNRDASDQTGTISEFDAEQVMGGLVNKSSGWNAPTGVNAQFEYLQNAWQLSAAGLYGMAAMSVGVLIGGTLAFRNWRRGVSASSASEYWHHLAVTGIREGYGQTGEGRVMAIYGVDASRRGRLRFKGGAESNFFNSNKAGRWQDPRSRYWLIGIGQANGEGGSFYYYGRSGDFRNIATNPLGESVNSMLRGGLSSGGNSTQVNLSGLRAFYREGSKLLYADHDDLLNKLRSGGGGEHVADRAFQLMQSVSTVTEGHRDVISALDRQLADFRRVAIIQQAELDAVNSLILGSDAVAPERMQFLRNSYNTTQQNLEFTTERVRQFQRIRKAFNRFNAGGEFDTRLAGVRDELNEIWETVRNDSSNRTITARYTAFNEAVQARGIFDRVATMFTEEGADSVLVGEDRKAFLTLLRGVFNGDFFLNAPRDPRTPHVLNLQEAAGLQKMEARFITEAQGGFTAVLAGQADNWLLSFGKNLRDGTVGKNMWENWRRQIHAEYRNSQVHSLISNATRNSRNVDSASIRDLVENIFNEVNGLASSGDIGGANTRFNAQDQHTITRFLTNAGLSDDEAKQLIKEMGGHFESLAANDFRVASVEGAKILMYGGLLPAFGAGLSIASRGIALSANMFSARGYFDVGFGLSVAGDSTRSEVDRVYGARMAIADLPMLGESVMMNMAFTGGYLAERMFSSWNVAREANIAAGRTGRAAIGAEARGFVRGLLLDSASEQRVATQLTARATSLSVVEAGLATDAAGRAAAQRNAVERGFITRAEGQSARVTRAGMRQYARMQAVEFGMGALTFSPGRAATAARNLASVSPIARTLVTGGLPGLVAGSAVALTGGSPEAAILTGMAIGSLGAMLFSPIGIWGTIAVGLTAALMFKWLENPLEHAITSAFKGKEVALLNYLDNNPWATKTLNAVSAVSTTAQTFLDETLGQVAKMKDNPSSNGLQWAVGGLAGGLHWLFSPLSKTSSSYVFYDPDYAKGMSVSGDPSAWRMVNNEGSAFDVAGMTPLWHGEMRDAVNKKITDQERIRTGDPNLLLQEWFHPTKFGQTDSLGQSIMRSSLDPNRNSNIWHNFGNLSTFGEASQHIMRDRALATQFQMTRLLERWNIWNDWSRTYQAKESGYGRNLNRTIKTAARSFKVSPAYNQAYIAERSDLQRSRGFAQLISPGIGQFVAPPTNFNRTPGSLNQSGAPDQNRDRDGLLGVLGVLGLMGAGYGVYRWARGRFFNGPTPPPSASGAGPTPPLDPPGGSGGGGRPILDPLDPPGSRAPINPVEPPLRGSASPVIEPDLDPVREWVRREPRTSTAGPSFDSRLRGFAGRALRALPILGTALGVADVGYNAFNWSRSTSEEQSNEFAGRTLLSTVGLGLGLLALAPVGTVAAVGLGIASVAVGLASVFLPSEATQNMGAFVRRSFTTKPSATPKSFPSPSPSPSLVPVVRASLAPSASPTLSPTPSPRPSVLPTIKPTVKPSPSLTPTIRPTPTLVPRPVETLISQATPSPSLAPTLKPTSTPDRHTSRKKVVDVPREGRFIAIFGEGVNGNLAFPGSAGRFEEEYIADILGNDKTYTYRADSISEFPTFLQNLKKMRESNSTLRNQKFTLVLQSHGAGGNGFVFYEGRVAKNNKNIVLEAASYSWMYSQIQQAGFSAEEVEIIMNSCNAATSYKRTIGGFTEEILNNLNRYAQGYVRQHSKISGKISLKLLDSKEKTSEPYNPVLTLGLSTELLPVSLFSMNKFEGVAGDPGSRLSYMSNLPAVVRPNPMEYSYNDSFVSNLNQRFKDARKAYIKEEKRIERDKIDTEINLKRGPLYPTLDGQHPSEVSPLRGFLNKVRIKVSDWFDRVSTKTRELYNSTWSVPAQKKAVSPEPKQATTPKPQLHIALFGREVGGDFEMDSEEHYINDVLGKNTFAYRADSISEFPKFLQIVKEERKKLKNPKEKTIIVIAGHAGPHFSLGFFRGEDFSGDVPLAGAKKVIREYASASWIKAQLEQSNLKSDEVEILMNTCNTSTSFFNTNSGFTPSIISYLTRDTAKVAAYYKKQGISTSMTLFDSKVKPTKNFNISGSQGIAYGLVLLTSYLTNKQHGVLSIPNDDVVDVSTIKAKPAYRPTKYGTKLDSEPASALLRQLKEKIKLQRTGPALSDSSSTAQPNPSSKVPEKPLQKGFLEKAWNFVTGMVSILWENTFAAQPAYADEMPDEWAATRVTRPGTASVRRRTPEEMTAGTAGAFGWATIAGWFTNVWNKVKEVASNAADSLFGPRGSTVTAQQGITTSGLRGGMIQHVKDFQAMFKGAVLSSAFREDAHNKTIGGVSGSYHTTGMAFDMVGIPGEGTATATQVHKWAASRSMTALWHDAGSGYHWHFQPIRGRESAATAEPHTHPAGGGGGGGIPNPLSGSSTISPSPGQNVSKNLALLASADAEARLPAALAAGQSNHGITNRMLENLNKYDPAIQAASKRFGVPVNLIRAHILAESGGVNNPSPNSAGAIGVMQVVGAYHSNLAKNLTGSSNLGDETVNIMTGTRLISGHMKSFNGQVLHAIAAYNAGEGAVGKYGGVPPYSETQKYVGTVAAYYHSLSKISGAKETINTGLLDAYVADQKNRERERLLAQERYKVQFTASVSAENDPHNHDQYSSEIEGRTEVQLYRDPVTARQVARATYPDGTKWTSAWDRHFTLVENSGLDNHFRGRS